MTQWFITTWSGHEALHHLPSQGPLPWSHLKVPQKFLHNQLRLGFCSGLTSHQYITVGLNGHAIKSHYPKNLKPMHHLRFKRAGFYVGPVSKSTVSAINRWHGLSLKARSTHAPKYSETAQWDFLSEPCIYDLHLGPGRSNREKGLVHLPE